MAATASVVTAGAVTTSVLGSFHRVTPAVTCFFSPVATLAAPSGCFILGVRQIVVLPGLPADRLDLEMLCHHLLPVVRVIVLFEDLVVFHHTTPVLLTLHLDYLGFTRVPEAGTELRLLGLRLLDSLVLQLLLLVAGCHASGAEILDATGFRFCKPIFLHVRQFFNVAAFPATALMMVHLQLEGMVTALAENRVEFHHRSNSWHGKQTEPGLLEQPARRPRDNSCTRVNTTQSQIPCNNFTVTQSRLCSLTLFRTRTPTTPTLLNSPLQLHTHSRSHFPFFQPRHPTLGT